MVLKAAGFCQKCRGVQSHAGGPWKCQTFLHMLKSMLARPVAHTSSTLKGGGSPNVGIDPQGHTANNPSAPRPESNICAITGASRG